MFCIVLHSERGRLPVSCTVPTSVMYLQFIVVVHPTSRLIVLARSKHNKKVNSQTDKKDCGFGAMSLHGDYKYVSNVQYLVQRRASPRYYTVDPMWLHWETRLIP